jgi:hypothetical protein
LPASPCHILPLSQNELHICAGFDDYPIAKFEPVGWTPLAAMDSE